MATSKWPHPQPSVHNPRRPIVQWLIIDRLGHRFFRGKSVVSMFLVLLRPRPSTGRSIVHRHRLYRVHPWPSSKMRKGGVSARPFLFLFLFLPRLVQSAAGLFKIPLTDRCSRISIPPCRPVILKAIVTGLSPSFLAGGFPLRWMVNILIEWTLARRPIHRTMIDLPRLKLYNIEIYIMIRLNVRRN